MFNAANTAARARINYPRATKAFYLMVSVSFALWLVVLATTQIHKFGPSAYFYSEQLSPLYWIGLGLLIMAILALILAKTARLYSSHFVLDLACIAMLALYLFGTPSFIYDMPRFGDVYHVLEMTGMMIKDASFMLTGVGGDYGYLNSFPGAIIFFSFVKLASGLSDYTLANLYVPYLMILLASILYILVRRLSSHFALLAPVGFLSLSWVQEYHLSPQSLALILYLCLWFFIITQVMPRRNPLDGQYSILTVKNRSLTGYLVLAILSISIVMSHPGTPIFLFLNLVVPYFALKAFKRLHIINLNFSLFDVLVITVPFAFWLAFVAHSYVDQAITMLSSTFLSLSSSNVETGTVLITVQPDQAIVDSLRRIITIAEGIIGGLSIVLLLRKESRNEAIIFGSWFLSCFVFQVFGFAQNFVSGRFLIFAIFPFAILLALVLAGARKHRLNMALSLVALALLVLSALAIPLVNFGGDYYEFKPLTGMYMDNFRDSKSIPFVNPCYYQGDDLLKVNASDMPNVYLINGPEYYNLFQVKFSKGCVYAGMFGKAGQSSIYTNGDYSLHGYIVNSPSQ